jgi:MFS superfamily sulfate permease-like transporter
MPDRHLHWILDYQREWLRSDVIAGLTAAAVVIPMAMAYATIAGLPVQVGLYTALVPMLIYALLGSSRPLSVSTTSTIAILVGTKLAEIASTGEPAPLLSALATLTLSVGAILFLASLLHFGFVANFISHPVLVGFKSGIGLVIVTDQVPKLLGIHVVKGPFLHNVAGIIEGLPGASAATVIVGAATIAILLGVERVLPRGPAPLIAVAGGIAGTALLDLQSHGVQAVGRIPEGLPSLTLPDLSLLDQLWPAALGIALMSFTETIAAGRAFAGPDEPPPRANRELMATGLANAGGALLGAMPAGGGTSQTAVNRFAGARSQLASLVTDRRHPPHHVCARPPCRTDAAGDSCGGRPGLLDQADRSRGVPSHLRNPASGVRLDHRRASGGGAARDVEGDCRRHPRISACACL